MAKGGSGKMEMKRSQQATRLSLTTTAARDGSATQAANRRRMILATPSSMVETAERAGSGMVSTNKMTRRTRSSPTITVARDGSGTRAAKRKMTIPVTPNSTGATAERVGSGTMATRRTIRQNRSLPTTIVERDGNGRQSRVGRRLAMGSSRATIGVKGGSGTMAKPIRTIRSLPAPTGLKDGSVMKGAKKWGMRSSWVIPEERAGRHLVVSASHA